MNFYEIKNKNKDFYPAILLEKCLNKNKRNRLRSVLFYAMSASFLFVVLTFPKFGIEFILESANIYRSIFVLLFVFWFVMYLFEWMYLSYYFRESKIDFEVLKLSANSSDKDITKSFVESELGSYALIRLGITPDLIKQFLNERTDFVTEAEYEIIENDDDEVTFAEFGYSLIHFDTDFRKLLKEHAITPQDFKKTLEWVSRIAKKIRNEERWWSKERLDRIPSLGTNLAFGQIYYLEKFGHSIYTDSIYLHLGDKWRLYKDTLLKIEEVLTKDQGANVIITSRESATGMEAVSALAKDIVLGTTLPELENKRVYVLDSNQLLSVYEDITEFEKMFSNILYQAAKAGNVILVFPHFSDFTENAHHKGVDIKDYLTEVMSSTNIQIIAISNQKGFHESLETDLDLMRNFEKISIEDLDYNSSIIFAEDEAMIIESTSNVIFTFQALKMVVESADRYFSESSITDKIADILAEIKSYCSAHDIILIKEEHVAEVVENKTGVPLGVLSEREKEKLSNIEMLLKQKVIGQDRVIESIADAMKRARLGVANPKRPLGSFLFIGPTGVGKTETSKALAEIFFGEEDDMIRIDMTEFNSGDSVTRLIGSADSSGILSSKIRDKQYGVLLLDEFEKAHDDVHNLFLQVLDEGYFSDGNGEKVNCRNLIIIATSNAGSDLMYEAINKGINFQSIKQEIIDHLVSIKLFRPEFLNRFDDLVLFNSLDDNTLESIVSLMINKLNKRLEDKGLDVKMNDNLSKYLVSKGKNKEFGARDINRVIQKEIETKIADALISGEIQKGDTIIFEEIGDSIEISKAI